MYQVVEFDSQLVDLKLHFDIYNNLNRGKFCFYVY